MKLYRNTETDCILTEHEVYEGFLRFCGDPDDVEELEEATREYNAKLGQDVSMFEMFLMWEISACNLQEVDE